MSAVIGKTGLCYYKGYGYGGSYQTYIDAINRTVDPDSDAPYVHYKSPSDGATNVDPATDIKARLTDDGYGIDLSSVTIEVEYPGSGGPIAGTLSEESGSNFIYYKGVFDPSSDLPLDTLITVTVNAEDLNNNTMTPEIWTFNTSATGVESASLGEIKATFK